MPISNCTNQGATPARAKAEKLQLIVGVWPLAGLSGIGSFRQRRTRLGKDTGILLKLWRSLPTAKYLPWDATCSCTHLPDTHRCSASCQWTRNMSDEVPAEIALCHQEDPLGSMHDHIYQNYPKSYSYGCSCLHRQPSIYLHKCTNGHIITYGSRRLLNFPLRHQRSDQKLEESIIIA